MRLAAAEVRLLVFASSWDKLDANRLWQAAQACVVEVAPREGSSPSKLVLADFFYIRRKASTRVGAGFSYCSCYCAGDGGAGVNSPFRSYYAK